MWCDWRKIRCGSIHILLHQNNDSARQIDQLRKVVGPHLRSQIAGSPVHIPISLQAIVFDRFMYELFSL